MPKKGNEVTAAGVDCRRGGFARSRKKRKEELKAWKRGGKLQHKIYLSVFSFDGHK